MPRHLALLIEKSEQVRTKWAEVLRLAGFSIISSATLEEALRLAMRKEPDVAITGSTADTSNLAACVNRVRSCFPGIPIVFAPADNSMELVIEAFRAGITDCVQPPVTGESLLRTVQRVLLRTSAGREQDAMIGESKAMRAIRSAILRFAPTECNVLITGESGTGKELAARTIHRHSTRSDKPFVVINCAAVPDTLVESEFFGHEKGSFTGADGLQQGKIQMANGGTVLFDEIGDMSLYAQTKILRLVETKEIQRLGTTVPSRVDIRIVAATNQDLTKLCAEGKFRRDLYFRLNVARLHMPPLRERIEDVPLLLEHGLAARNRQAGRTVGGFTEEALSFLLSHDWPGNVRELNNLIEASFAGCTGERISLYQFPKACQTLSESADSLSASEKERLVSALTSCNWNKSKAAQELHWSRMTLYRKLAKHQLAKQAS